MTTTDTPRTDAFFNRTDIEWYDEVLFTRQLERELLAARHDNFYLAIALSEAEADLEKLKAGKVFVDPKWVYDLETQLAKAHEELCQAGLREYGN